MDYRCAKFGDFSLSRFGFIHRTDRITESHTKADDRYTHATTISVSKERDETNLKVIRVNKWTK